MDTIPESEQQIPKEQVAPIVFKNKDKEFQVKPTEIDELFADIGKYNQQFSMGAMLTQALFSHIRLEDEEASTPKGLEAVKETQQHLTASGINLIHENTLKKLGLTLEPISGKHARIFHAGEEVGEGEMRVNIVDRSQFLAFLNILEPNQVQDSQLKNHLQDLSQILSQQLYDNYNLEKPQDEMLELFGGLEQTINQYRRLGLGESVKRLETYLKNARNGSLREYIAVERYNLLANPGESFGPSDWQKDAGPESLSQRWEIAINTLKRLQSNPKAQELYQQLRNNLNKGVETAQTDLPTLVYYSPEAKIKLSDVLNKARVNLEEFKN